jgi:hypothetical protein
MGATISQTFDSGINLETKDQLFISGVGLLTKDSNSTIIGYYVSPFSKTESQYVYKPITQSVLFMGVDMDDDAIINTPTSAKKFAHGYFLANVTRNHTLTDGVETEVITFIAKNHEGKSEDYTITVQTDMSPNQDYKVVKVPDPTTCKSGQYIKQLGQVYETGSAKPRTFTHACQDVAHTSGEFLFKLFGGLFGLLFLVFLLYMSGMFGTSVRSTDRVSGNNPGSVTPVGW